MNRTIATGWKQNFFTIAVGQSISLVGSSAVQFSLIWWLTTETSSAMMLALAGMMAYLPHAIFGSFVGVWIDRWKRKYVVIIADLFQGILATLFALWLIFGTPPYWSVCLLLGLRGLGSVFHTPAIQAIVPLLVPTEKLIKANGWNSFMQSGAYMLGPALGAVMYAALPLWVILLSDLFGALVASSTMAVIKVPELSAGIKEQRHFLREMKEGLSVFCHDPKLGVVSIAAFLCMVFYIPLSSLYPLMTSDYFHGTSLHAGATEVIYAIGMMGCSLLLGLFGNIKNKLLFIHFGLLMLGGTALICGLLPSTIVGFWIFAALCVFMGAGGNLYNTPFVAYVQETVAPEAQGRVFAFIGSAMSLAMPLGLLIAGPMAEHYGISPWFLITGIADCAVALISIFIIHHIGKTSS